MKILIIEDDIKLSGFLKKSFEAEYFAVDVAGDGEEGLYLAKTNDYDLLILDNKLPKKTGPEVCDELRKEGYKKPILILSVKTEPRIKTELLNIGADDYLGKPFSFQELLARVRALLRRPHRIEEEVIKVNGVTLDTKRFVVFCNKKNIYLTRKEFSLLEYLMRNRGIVLSRSMILEHVWDMNADPFSNTIESHIVSLRKKLSQSKQRQLIQTVPGRGYKID